MSSRFTVAALISLALAGAAAPVSAQSDILLRLRSGSPMGDRFRVDSAGGVVAIGQLGVGIIPATGPGERMMWYPFKGAFRAGSPGGSGTNAWDDTNIGFYSWAGGYQTQASAYASFAFGDQVVVSGVDAAGFGASHTVSGTVGFATGASNLCTGFSCVAMGYTNRASGQGSVAIGYRVHASENYAVALGHRAHAKNSGAFAWADASTTDSLRSTANNQFSTRAAGGYRLFTNAALTAGVTMSAGGSTWNAVSDQYRKEHFLPVDGEDILQRIRQVPVTSWRYIAEEDRTVRHIGPMAQDWQRAFGFSSDDTTINMGDFDGVNLAAVQALERRTAELQQENAALRSQLAELQQQNAAVHAQLTELLRRVERLESGATRQSPPAGGSR
jgi:trimeric autotransporter adhesin